MIKTLSFFSIILTLCFVAASYEDVFAAPCTLADPCQSQIRTDISSKITGVEYQIDSPDLYIDRSACSGETAVSGAWLIADPIGDNRNVEWVESGITEGEFRKGGVEDPRCVTKSSIYYGIHYVDEHDYIVYHEYIVPNGGVDPGEDVTITIEEQNGLGVAVTVSTPSLLTYPARVSLHPDNLYNGYIGIEGTVSATAEYSSIPMSKFTNMKVKQNNSWIPLPSSATVFAVDTDQGYLGQKCSSNSFVAGTVTSIDCNVIAVRNQIPLVSNIAVDSVTTGTPIIINLDAVDTDRDYLKYNLVGTPTNGILSHNSLSQNIPNTDGDSSQLVYTPTISPPEFDTIRYSATDGRFGHTREGLITIMGSSPSSIIPDAVDDFAYIRTGTSLYFTWSYPHDGGSDITFYRTERSNDAVNWEFHDIYSKNAVGFSYARHEGYNQYFRIFANNVSGASAASNVLYISIPDTSPPDIRIQSPSDGTTIMTPFVFVEGHISEDQNSGIENIEIKVDGNTSPNPITHIGTSSDARVSFESTLTGLSNGERTITAFTENSYGLQSSASTTITVDAPIPSTLTFFSDTFETDMSNWILTTQGNTFWSVRDSPIAVIPDSTQGNKVAGTENCDNVCAMIMIDNVDLTQMTTPELSFYRYVATGADISSQEGIIVYISEDNGITWSVLERFTADEFDDDGVWHFQEYDLSSYSSSQFKLRFDGISNSSREGTEIDDVLIYDASADTTSPVFSNVPDTINVETSSISGVAINYDLPTARDDISGNTVVVCNPQSGQILPIGQRTITCQTQDDSGNVSEISFSVVVTLVDIAPPTLVIPADITAEATGVMTQVNLGSATATDLVDSSPTITRSPTTDIFPVGTHTITWTGTDDAGNTASDTQIITIQDTTPPDITAPSDVTLEATSLLSMISLGNAIATDLVDTFPTITSDAPTSFPVGITTITYTATDDVGNFATDTQTVTIQDTTSPMLVLPADVTAEATGILTVLDIGTVTITDNVANNITATNDAPASFPLGDTIVTWSGTDTAGNTVTDTQTVTIQDTTAPVVDVIDDIISDDGTTTVEFEVIATDIFPVVISCDHNSGDTFDVGITTQVTCIVTDSNDNQSSVSFSVTVSPASVTITHIFDGKNFVPFVDGITIHNNVPQFRGTSSATSYLKLDIDDTPVGNSLVIRPNGDWERAWNNIPLDDGTYTIDVITQDGTNSGTYTIVIGNPTPPPPPPASVTITRIHDGNSYVAFTDGITIENNTPRFRGTSQNVSYFTLDIDGDLVGRNTDTRSDGDWTRKWKSTPLENGTYTLNIKTQNDVNIGVYSITIATPTPMATITHVRDGNDFIPFVDGMTIQNNSPKFVGASENVESAQLLLCDTQVGNSNAIHNSNGAFQRNWKNAPLEDGTCQLVLQSNGTVYFSASITIDANNDGNPESSFITVTDEFENLDSWRFTDTFGIYPPGTYIENNNYNFTRDDSTGNPAPSGLISGDGFIATSTISREIDLIGIHDNPLYLGIDYRVTSQAVGSVVTNAKLEISNSTGGLLYENMLVAGGTLDTNWRTFSLDISEFVQDGDTITVSMISIDPWIVNWNQKLYVDNFYIGTSNPAAQNQGASGSLGLEPTPLTQEQILSQQIAQGNYNLYNYINGVRVAGEYDDVIDELLRFYNVTSGN